MELANERIQLSKSLKRRAGKTTSMATALLLVSAASMLSCKTARPSNDSNVKDLAFNSSSETKNVLAIFTAPNPVGNSAVGIPHDASDVIEGISALEQGFRVYKNEAATSAIVEGWVTGLVDADHLSDDGTLFIYIAGHGAPNAQAQMNDGTFVGYNQLAKAIKTGRQGKPLKRLVVMIFGCFSGSWIDVVRNYNNPEIAEQVFVLTSSTAGQYSMFNGTNSQLVQAFRTVLASYVEAPKGVTLGRFFQDIQRNVPGSTPQYYATKPELLNETLFSKEVLKLHVDATTKGIMPSPKDFSAGKRTPDKATILAHLESSFDPEINCKYDILKAGNGAEICSGWNRKDVEKVAVFEPARSAGSSRCDAPLLYSHLTGDTYRNLYDHCNGILRAKSSL